MTQIPADWYPDPDDATAQRWWDGYAWTEHRQPVTAPEYPTYQQDEPLPDTHQDDDRAPKSYPGRLSDSASYGSDYQNFRSEAHTRAAQSQSSILAKYVAIVRNSPTKYGVIALAVLVVLILLVTLA